ncbi:hypothetical protein B0T22DRAFT_373344 [Podospora appendiculata]|uniref:Transmembrane protein n=1 Tax=Podospora appendiculata TaxID=314037 RepID=A0AAE1CH97_9PEZI|nr:hypothetical protein B0T22DRAFT_373344 [Podospora appendiculata]
MCYQVLEVYSTCRCLYYQHAIDRCAAYGKPRHGITIKTILVGYNCGDHELMPRDADNAATRGLDTLDEGELEEGKDDTIEETPFGKIKVKSGVVENYMYDVEDSDFSDTDSVMSAISATSSVTTVDIDPIEEIFHRLLVFQDLQFLWPQLVCRSRSRRASLRTIERFLRRYAEDLAQQVQVAASRFVRRSRLNLAQRIFEAHQTVYTAYRVSEDVAVGEQTVTEDLKTGMDMMDDESDEDNPPSFTYLVAEAFLFETDPILYLQANVKAFVKMPSRPKELIETVNSSFRQSLENAISRLGRPPVAEGKRRITWKCKCGRQLYDDFVELREGAVKELETQLRLQNTDDTVPTVIHGDNDDDLPHNEKTGGNRFTGAVLQTWQSIQNLLGLLASTKGILPRHRQSHRRSPPDSELGLCPSAGSSNAASRFHNFVLLCVPFQRWAAKLHQAEVCRINSDQEFFQVMRQCYSHQRGRSAWTRFRMVRGIEFVKARVYRSQLVDVQFRPSIPPDGTASDYAYEPLPAEIMPPIGSNHLMHLFEHPEDAEATPVLYRKIPKKLRAKLEACPTKGSSVGWGLHFVEGMNWVVLFIYGCAGFGLSLLAAVVWATVRADVQGAFAIAGFMIAFMMFCAGIARSEIDG